MISGYVGSAPDAQAIYQAVFKEETDKPETPGVTETAEKVEASPSEDPSDDTIKDSDKGTVNHTEGAVTSLMSQIKLVFWRIADFLRNLLGR